MQIDCIYMIIGFLGKGGSGKSTLSSGFVKYLEAMGKSVLAIDADHNMDLSFNLGGNTDGPFFGSSMDEMKRHIGLDPKQNYRNAFSLPNEPEFNLTPLDPYTEKYSQKISESIRLMTAGPHTEEIFKDVSCSHSLFTPLKIYLPYLKLSPDEFAVVDEKAGADGAGTGIPSGFDLAIIVTEPTEHGTKTALQIARMLDMYKTPYIFVGNKIVDREHKNFLTKKLGGDIIHFPFHRKSNLIHHKNFGDIFKKLTSLKSTRKVRSKAKITKTSSLK